MQSLPEKAAGEPGADKQEPDESLKPLVLPAVTLAVCFLAIVCGSVSLVTYMSHAHRAATDMFVDDVARMMKQSLRSFDPVAALTPRLTAMASSAALLSAVNGTGQPCGAFTSSVFDPLAAAALGPTGEGWVHWVPRVAQQQREKWESVRHCRDGCQGDLPTAVRLTRPCSCTCQCRPLATHTLTCPASLLSSTPPTAPRKPRLSPLRWVLHNHSFLSPVS